MLLIAGASFTAPSHAAMFTVTNTNNDGAGSLRQAIVEANTTAAADTIAFNIPGSGVQTINIDSALPTVTDALTIDGTTQPGVSTSPRVALNGANAGFANGLELRTTGSRVLGLSISGFGREGIEIVGGGQNIVGGCYIGTDASGTRALANGGRGVRIQNSQGNVIGEYHRTGDTDSIGAPNVISGNRSHGVYIAYGGDNKITGNFIGTSAGGVVALGNGADGIRIENSAKNLIGVFPLGGSLGDTLGGSNVISGNARDGISIVGGGASGNNIGGNTIGRLASGAAFGNGGNGIRVENAPRNAIGITFEARISRYALGNRIFGNGSNGILLLGIAAKNNSIVGNSIGVDQYGTAEQGNQGDGIEINNAPANLIGGAFNGLGNVISSNHDCGVRIVGTLSTTNVLSANLIGTNRQNIQAGNANDGVRIINASGNTIGAERQEHLNTIAHNGGNGVLVVSGTRNAITLNEIYKNGKLGIDLGAGDGVTRNDVGDVDSGANDRLNFPELLAAQSITSFGGDGSPIPGVEVRGRFNSRPDTEYKLRFFANAAPDASGYGEGQRYIGFRSIRTDIEGNANFVFRALQVASGEFITATASNGTIGTSEFSRAAKVAVQAPVEDAAPTISVTSPTNGATLSALPVIEGTFRMGTLRVDRIEVFIQRRSDKKYFDGEDWGVIAPRFRAAARNERLWRYNGPVPSGAQLRPDTYQILAIAFDASGNRGQAVSTIRIVGSGSST